MKKAINRIRTTDERGFVNDGLGGIRKGDVFKTLSGRLSTPYPTEKITAKADIEVNKWLIQNAILEAEARFDKYNLCIFSSYDAKNLQRADTTGINLYVFGTYWN